MRNREIKNTGTPDISDMIEKSGCSKPYYDLENCLGENDRDFKKCQDAVSSLRICYEEKAKLKENM
jgi:hypothetical protein